MTPDAELNAYLAALTPGRVDYMDTDTGKLATIYTPPECTASACCGKTVHAEHRDDCPQHPVPASPAAPVATQGTNVAAGASGGESGAERRAHDDRSTYGSNAWWDANAERLTNLTAERDAARAELARVTESDAHHRRACSAKAGQLARVTAVHAEYFDMGVDPWDACPEPEDFWRYDRDFRAALLAPTEDQS